MKRGQVIDSLSIAVVILVFIVVAVFGVYFSNQWHAGFIDALNNSGIPVTEQTEVLLDKADSLSNMFVSLVPNLVIFLAIGAIITAWFVPTSPIFIGLSVIFLIVFEIIYAAFSDFLYSFLTTPALAYIGNANPGMVWIATHLPLVVGGITVLIIIVQSIRASGSSLGQSFQ